jgi:hypothetical protein
MPEVKGQAEKVKRSLDDFIEGAIEAAEETKKKAAAECFRAVMKKSPVWSGQYIRSHRVGIGKLDKRHGKSSLGSSFAFPPKMEESAANSLKASLNEFETRILLGKKISIDKSIYISNSIGHAADVEYIGWKYTGPHHVFGLAAEKMKTRFPQILKLEVSQNAKLK